MTSPPTAPSWQLSLEGQLVASGSAPTLETLVRLLKALHHQAMLDALRSPVFDVYRLPIAPHLLLRGNGSAVMVRVAPPVGYLLAVRGEGDLTRLVPDPVSAGEALWFLSEWLSDHRVAEDLTCEFTSTPLEEVTPQDWTDPLVDRPVLSPLGRDRSVVATTSLNMVAPRWTREFPFLQAIAQGGWSRGAEAALQALLDTLNQEQA